MIRALNRSVKLYIPPEASYNLIQPYVREACKLAWECSSLAHSLDVALATDSELFDEHKYVNMPVSACSPPSQLVNTIWECDAQFSYNVKSNIYALYMLEQP